MQGKVNPADHSFVEGLHSAGYKEKNAIILLQFTQEHRDESVGMWAVIVLSQKHIRLIQKPDGLPAAYNLKGPR